MRAVRPPSQTAKSFGLTQAFTAANSLEVREAELLHPSNGAGVVTGCTTSGDIKLFSITLPAPNRFTGLRTVHV